MSYSHNGQIFKRVLKWSKYRPSTKWAEEEIILSNEASPITGKFSFDETPHLKEILNDRENDNVEEQFIFTATQWGKTQTLFIQAGKMLDDGDGKGMLVIPTQDMVPTYVKEKIDPFLNSINAIKSKIENKRVETKAGKLESALKVTPASSLRIAGNTAHTRSSFTVKNLFMDEVRLFKSGDVEELRGRTKAFEKYGRKILGVSSKESDSCEATLTYKKMECKKVHHTYCSDCEEMFYAGSKEFGLISVEDYKKLHEIEDTEFEEYKYKKYAIDNIHIQCPECGYKITNDEREKDIREGRTKFIVTQGDPKKDKSIGYKSNTLYSLLTTLEAIASEIIDAGQDIDKLSRLYRDYFNEIYIQNATHIDIQEFLSISNGLKTGVIPKNTWKIILGIDNQKDHLYFELNAYQYGSIKNVVKYGKVYGYGIGEDWEFMREIIKTPLIDEDGNTRYIDYVGVDRRGYNQDDYARTDEANQFIISIMEWQEENGIEGDFIYGIEGVPKISGDMYFKVREDKENTTESGKKVKVISMSNLKVKNRLSLHIGRSINKATGDEKASKYTTKLMYINQDIVDEAYDRADEATKKGKEYKTPRDAFESHYTSEVYDVKKDIWINDKQKRVDYADCGCMSETIALKQGVDLATPVEVIDNEGDFVEDMLDTFKP
jgi:phage terminase large subunit GpA-like protein